MTGLRTLSTMLILGSAASLHGCGSDSETEPAARDVTLQFSAVAQDRPISCGETVPGIGSGPADRFRVDDFRFFVSKVTLQTSDGREIPLELEQDGMWQVEDVALLDFEDGCAAGTPRTRSVVTGTVSVGPDEPLTGVCFDLGVPFELNHRDPVTQPSPLNSSGMFWNWQGGYKFLRIDGVGDPDGLAVGYNVHLGSTGCVSSGPTTPPQTQCKNPNRPRVCLSPFDPDHDRIHARLDALLEDADVTVNTPDTAPGCMSGNADPECIPVLPKLGLDFVYDDGANPPVTYPAQTPQRFFAVARPDA